MKVMRHLLDKKHLKLLYTSYIKSNIEYCCLLFTACPMYMLAPIIKLQKQAIRIIENLPSRAHTAELFKSNGILPFNLLIEFNVCKFMHAYKLGSFPKIFENTWNFIQDRHTYGTRNRNNFAYELGINRNFLLHAPLNSFPTIFNGLPLEIKLIENKNIFKRKCFTHFLTTGSRSSRSSRISCCAVISRSMDAMASIFTWKDLAMVGRACNKRITSP